MLRIVKKNVNVLVAWLDDLLKSKPSASSPKVREQSQSIVRGEHPIAFMLPTVSLSDVGSETEVNSLLICLV